MHVLSFAVKNFYAVICDAYNGEAEDINVMSRLMGTIISIRIVDSDIKYAQGVSAPKKKRRFGMK
jgi:hypothetical protein